MVGGVDLLLVQAAAVEQPDLLVGHVLDALEQHRVAAEEVLAHVRAVARLERLVLAVDALLHDLDQPAVGVGGQQRIPARTPDHLDHVPAGAAEVGLELLDDLAVAADRAVEALEVAVDDPDQVVELLAAGQRRSRPSTRARPSRRRRGTPTPCGRRSAPGPAGLEVLHEPRLVDRGDRADPERDRRELPVIGHQPRVRVGRQPVAAETSWRNPSSCSALSRPSRNERA